MAEPQLILIVEHDVHVRELQQFFLEKAGFAVAFHDNGVDALAAVTGTVPSAVVTEILVPGLDGLTLCRRIREDPRTRHVPIVVFSILAAATRATAAGATAFLRKPIVESTFLTAVRDAMAVATIDAPSPGLQEQRWASKS